MTDDFDALLDEALEGEEIHPSLRFRSAVMDTVRATATPPLPFPWRRIGLSCGIAAGAAFVAAWDLPVAAAGAPPSAVWLLPFAVLAALTARLVAAVAGD